MAKGVAEIALLLVLLETGVITREVFSLLAFIMFGYILVMPSVIGLAVAKAKDPEQATPPGAVPPSFARHALEGVCVSSIMDRTRAYPAPELPVGDFLTDWTVPNQQDYLVVVDDAPVGTVSLARAQRLDERLRARTPLGDLLRRNIPRAWPDEPVDDVLERMTDHSVSVIPIVERDTGRFLGSVASYDIVGLGSADARDRRRSSAACRRRGPGTRLSNPVRVAGCENLPAPRLGYRPVPGAIH